MFVLFLIDVRFSHFLNLKDIINFISVYRSMSAEAKLFEINLYIFTCMNFS